MKYVDKLLHETNFLQQLEQLEQLEQKRQFCSHGLGHLLDTARIAWITYLEQREVVPKAEQFDKEMIYLAALLHDLGRILECEEGIPHHEAGVKMAEVLLREINYPEDKRKQLQGAIYTHRTEEKERKNALGQLLYWADKKSRNCFACKAYTECKWSSERRNQTILY